MGRVCEELHSDAAEGEDSAGNKSGKVEEERANLRTKVTRREEDAGDAGGQSKEVGGRRDESRGRGLRQYCGVVLLGCRRL
eukprot:758241-Hanusia_phi.AAC.8